MEAGSPGGATLVCLYCGTEAASMPPYEVMYCYCRSGADGGPVPGDASLARPA